VVNFFFHSAALLAARVLRAGPLRVSAYGLCAAVGLLAALGLSQRTAPLAGLREPALWDAGIFTATAAFVLSRVLLIVRDPRALLHYPLLVLTLPSYTTLGMALTAAATMLYLHRRRLPLLRVLDAWSPCAALLAAALGLGHFLEGTDAGMPTQLPWGVASPVGSVHPVQMYAMAAALALGAVLWRLLLRGKRAGSVAAVALIAGGLLALLLEMLTQPAEPFGRGWLETNQWIAMGSICAGVVIWVLAPFQQECA
jgi:phosphatidylglycerol:prolipoprotein diacylglycerol transferase